MTYFATHNLSSTQIMSLFWEAVFILEKSCNLWLIATTADGASPNRCFFKLHQNMDGMSSSDVCYGTINIWARHRFIWFISDPPHLIKTLRNCLHHSSFGKSSRLMWNNDQYMLWEQIVRVSHLDKQDQLQYLPKITYNHLNLTSYSVMHVNLAAQFLSKTTAVALRKLSPSDSEATATFCEMIDSFFDCLNVRSLEESTLKRKANLAAYTSVNDPRFNWLIEDFLWYFDK